MIGKSGYPANPLDTLRPQSIQDSETCLLEAQIFDIYTTKTIL